MMNLTKVKKLAKSKLGWEVSYENPFNKDEFYLGPRGGDHRCAFGRNSQWPRLIHIHSYELRPWRTGEELILLAIARECWSDDDE